MFKGLNHMEITNEDLRVLGSKSFKLFLGLNGRQGKYLNTVFVKQVPCLHCEWSNVYRNLVLEIRMGPRLVGYDFQSLKTTSEHLSPA